MTCYSSADGKLTICTTGETYIVGTEREPERWCFGCRKRLPGTHICRATVEPSWYGPTWTYECDGCHRDRRWLSRA